MKARQTAARFDADNLAAARILAADPVKYPAGSLPAVWAALVLAKAAPTIKGPLFRQRAA